MFHPDDLPLISGLGVSIISSTNSIISTFDFLLANSSVPLVKQPFLSLSSSQIATTDKELPPLYMFGPDYVENFQPNYLISKPRAISSNKKKEFSNINDAIITNFIVPSIKRALHDDTSSLPKLFEHLNQFINSESGKPGNCDIAFASGISEILFESALFSKYDTKTLGEVLNSCIKFIVQFGSSIDCFLLAKAYLSASPPPNLELEALKSEINYSQLPKLFDDNKKYIKKPLIHFINNLTDCQICLFYGYLYVAGEKYGLLKIGTGFYGNVPGSIYGWNKEFKSTRYKGIGIINDHLILEYENSNRTETFLIDSITLKTVKSISLPNHLCFTTYNNTIFLINEDNILFWLRFDGSSFTKIGQIKFFFELNFEFQSVFTNGDSFFFHSINDIIEVNLSSGENSKHLTPKISYAFDQWSHHFFGIDPNHHSIVCLEKNYVRLPKVKSDCSTPLDIIHHLIYSHEIFESRFSQSPSFNTLIPITKFILEEKAYESFIPVIIEACRQALCNGNVLTDNFFRFFNKNLQLLYEKCPAVTLDFLATYLLTDIAVSYDENAKNDQFHSNHEKPSISPIIIEDDESNQKDTSKSSIMATNSIDFSILFEAISLMPCIHPNHVIHFLSDEQCKKQIYNLFDNLNHKSASFLCIICESIAHALINDRKAWIPYTEKFLELIHFSPSPLFYSFLEYFFYIFQDILIDCTNTDKFIFSIIPKLKEENDLNFIYNKQLFNNNSTVELNASNTSTKLNKTDSFTDSDIIFAHIKMIHTDHIVTSKLKKVFEVEIPLVSKITVNISFNRNISYEQLYLLIFTTKSQREHVSVLPVPSMGSVNELNFSFNASYLCVNAEVPDSVETIIKYSVTAEIPLLFINENFKTMNIFQLYWYLSFSKIHHYLAKKDSIAFSEKLFSTLFQNIPNFQKIGSYFKLFDISGSNFFKSNAQFIQTKLQSNDLSERLFYLAAAVKAKDNFSASELLNCWKELFHRRDLKFQGKVEDKKFINVYKKSNRNLSNLQECDLLAYIITNFFDYDALLTCISTDLMETYKTIKLDSNHLVILSRILSLFKEEDVNKEIIQDFVVSNLSICYDNDLLDAFENLFINFNIKIDAITDLIKSLLKNIGCFENHSEMHSKQYFKIKFLRKFMSSNALNGLADLIKNDSSCLFGSLLILSLRYAPISYNDNYEIELSNGENLKMKLINYNCLLFSFKTELGVQLSLPPYNFNTYLPLMNGINKILEAPLPALSNELINAVCLHLNGKYRPLVIDAICDISINNPLSINKKIYYEIFQNDDRLMPSHENDSNNSLSSPSNIDFDIKLDTLEIDKNFKESKEFSIVLSSFFSTKRKKVRTVFFGTPGTDFKIYLYRYGKYKLLLNDQHNREICIWSITDHFIDSVIPTKDLSVVECFFGVSPKFQVAYLKLGSHFWVNTIHSTPNMQNARLGIVGYVPTFHAVLADGPPDILIPSSPYTLWINSSLKSPHKFSKKLRKQEGEITLLPFIKNEYQRFYMEITHNAKRMRVDLVPSFFLTLVFYSFEIPTSGTNSTFGILIDFSVNAIAIVSNNFVIQESIRTFPYLPQVCIGIQYGKADTINFNFGPNQNDATGSSNFQNNIQSIFKFPEPSKMMPCDYKPNIEENNENRSSYSFEPSADCPFRPIGLSFPSDIGRPAFLSFGLQSHAGMICNGKFESATLDQSDILLNKQTESDKVIIDYLEDYNPEKKNCAIGEEQKINNEGNSISNIKNNSKLVLWSTPFETPENVEIATIHSMFFTRSRINPEFHQSFNRLISQQMYVYDGNFCTPHSMTMYNSKLSKQHLSETLINILHSFYCRKEIWTKNSEAAANKALLEEHFNKFLMSAINNISDIELHTNYCFSHLLFEIISTDKNFVTKYLSLSKDMFIEIDQQFKDSIFRSIHGNSVGYFERISDLECDAILIRPTKFSFIKDKIRFIDRFQEFVDIESINNSEDLEFQTKQNNDNNIKDRNGRLITLIRSEFIFHHITYHDAVMCFFLPIILCKPSFGLGWAFALHFVNHIVEYIKATKDKALSSLLHKYFLLPVWTHLMKTGEIPFDRYFAKWLSILIISSNNTFDYGAIHEYSNCFNYNFAISTSYKELLLVTTTLFVLSSCLAEPKANDSTSSDVKESITERQISKLYDHFQPDARNTLYSEFRLAIAADLMNPLGSNLPLFLGSFPVSTPLINEKLQSLRLFKKPLNIEIAPPLPSNPSIYIAPNGSFPIIKGIPIQSFQMRYCGSNNRIEKPQINLSSPENQALQSLSSIEENKDEQSEDKNDPQPHAEVEPEPPLIAPEPPRINTTDISYNIDDFSNENTFNSNNKTEDGIFILTNSSQSFSISDKSNYNKVLNISFLENSPLLPLPPNGVNINILLYELKEKWNLHYEAICFFVNNLLSIFDCEVNNFNMFQTFLRCIFPDISSDAAILQLSLTSFRYRRKNKFSTHKQQIPSDIDFILAISPDCIEIPRDVELFEFKNNNETEINLSNEIQNKNENNDPNDEKTSKTCDIKTKSEKNFINQEELFHIKSNTQMKLSDFYLSISKYFYFSFPHNYKQIIPNLQKKWESFTCKKNIDQIQNQNDLFIRGFQNESQNHEKNMNSHEWSKPAFVPNPEATSPNQLKAFTAFGTHMVIAFETGCAIPFIVSKFVIRYAFDCELLLDDFTDCDLTFALHGTKEKILKKLSPIKKQLDAIKLGVMKMKPIRYHSYFKLPYFPRVFQMMPFLDVINVAKGDQSTIPYIIIKSACIINNDLYNNCTREFITKEMLI